MQRISILVGVMLLLLAGQMLAIQKPVTPPQSTGEGMLRPRPPSLVPALLPAGFQESVVFSGLTEPTSVDFASDGRVFVAEKSGLIKVFDNLSDTVPTVFADLRTNVHNFWDRGLLGLVLDPNFPTKPYVYVLYTYDAVIGGTAPLWGTVGGESDGCPDPLGAGCVVSGRLSRLQAAGNVMIGSEQVLIENWCQQYPSHSIGALAFGADGALYVSGGDGASFTFVDYGQDGNPRNPCGDPPGGVGGSQTPPTAEGGALRSQDLRTSGDPVSLHGAILRVDPDTGAALPDNPLFSNPDANARRVVAYGLRNPFRLTTRPGTNEVWVGDVGWNDWEEINCIVDPHAGVFNFGWPCYEGEGHQPGYDGAALNICVNLYGQTNGVVGPAFTYNHSEKVVPGEPIEPGSSSISGLAFYNNGSYPAAYRDALFFSDYSRGGIWVMFNPSAPPPPPPPPSRVLVAAYGFNEGTGTSVADATGNGHTGTISGATWSTQGKFGNALSFDGVNDWATINSTALLNLTTGMTVEAWVFPTSTSGVRDILIKEGSNGDIYNLYSRNWAGRPESNVLVGGQNWTAEGTALAANVWTHVAGTYDGFSVRLFINGIQVASTSITGSIATSTGPLRIGGNSFWGEFFQGRLDEVRVYNGALTASEIQSDMNSPLSLGPVAPVAPAAPTETSIETFVADAADPVCLKIGPNGDLFYVDFGGGTIRRISYVAGNQPPTAVFGANPLSGPAPLTVNFDGTASSDPDLGDTLAYSWDLNGDGVFGDSTSAQPVNIYNAPGIYNVSLRVTDTAGASDTDTVAISVGSKPTATIDTPLGSTTWKVGDVIAFSGHATDPEDGTLAPSALSWSVIIHHCPSNCHTHSLQNFPGVASGSFPAPDHEYPAHLELILTATDSTGLTDTKSVLLNPQTVTLAFQSSPSGLQLVVGASSSTTPFTRTVIIGSNNSLSAPSPQVPGGQNYAFASWSDGGAQSHNIIAGGVAVTYTATYQSTTVTAFPSSTTILTGTLNSGTAAALTSDNNVYFAVNSTTTGTRTAAWYGAFTGVSNSLFSLQANYKGNNSRNCTQTIAIWNWTTSAWVQLDSRTVGTTEVAINNLVPTGTLGDYVSGLSGSGEVRVRIQSQATANFINRGDLMNIVYDAPVGPPPPDTTPPVPSNGSPTGVLAPGTTQAPLSLSTDENAICRYATSAGVPYGSMPNTFTTTGGTAHSTTVSGLTNGGSYNFFVRCQDTAGNANPTDFTISFSVAQPGVGLVAAYGFSEGTGTSVADATGNGHTGTISGATWSTQGKFGNALSFDGINDWATINSTALLNLTTGMTVEAWVFPTSTSGVRDILIKEGSNGDIYNLYSRNWAGRPESNVLVGGLNWTAEGTALGANVWTHVAGTYDGSTVRLFINGVQVASTAITGSITTSTGPLRIGGNSLWGEFFQGRIDEIRIYNRALSAAEIQADMAAPVN